MLKIEILGTGCSKCTKLYENVQIAVNEMSDQVEINKITKIDEIINYGVMFTPALVINGKVKIAGKIPSVEDIKKWLLEK